MDFLEDYVRRVFGRYLSCGLLWGVVALSFVLGGLAGMIGLDEAVGLVAALIIGAFIYYRLFIAPRYR